MEVTTLRSGSLFRAIQTSSDPSQASQFWVGRITDNVRLKVLTVLSEGRLDVFGSLSPAGWPPGVGAFLPCTLRLAGTLAMVDSYKNAHPTNKLLLFRRHEAGTERRSDRVPANTSED